RGSAGGLLERERHRIFHIRSAHRLGSPAARSRASPSGARASSTLVEKLLKYASDSAIAEVEIFHRRPPRPALPRVTARSTGAAPASGGVLIGPAECLRLCISADVPELIVLFPLLVVRQHVVRFLHFLELLRRLRVVAVHIRVVL